MGSNAIVTTPDSGSVGGVAGGSVEANIVADDTIGGATATLGGGGNATVKQDPASPAWPSFILLNTTTGAVTVAPGSPAGTYPVRYELCEVANPTNCKVETVTVTITPSISVAKSASSSSFIVGASGQYYDITVTVASGPTSAAISISDTLPVGISLSGAPSKQASSSSDGVLSGCPASGTSLTGCQIDSNASSGTIIIRLPVAVGSTATSGTNTASASGGGDPACTGAGACTSTTPPVSVGNTPIQANDETGSAPSIGGTAISNVYANDTLNGSLVDLSYVTGNVVTPAIPKAVGAPVPVLSPESGVVTVPPNTPVGSYTITYQICEKINTGNCSTATATVDVTDGTIAANPDTGSVYSATGGVAISNIVVNDSIKGAAAILGTSVDVSKDGSWPPAFTLDVTTGAVSVAPQTPAGVYTLPYQLCERGNASNCAKSTVTVTVKPSVITTTPDSATIPSGTGGVAIGNIADNDKLGGEPAIIGSNVTVIQDPNHPWSSQFQLDPLTGAVSVTPGTPAGVYTEQYQLCEKLNPSNCQLETVTITVSSGTVAAQPDSGTAPSTGGSAVANAYANDKLNGNPVSNTTVVGTVVQAANPVTPGALVPVLDTTTGEVTVPAGTPAGSYSISYKICEKTDLNNCATTTVSITVTAGAKGQISGKAYFDRDRNRVFSGNDSPLVGYVAVLSRQVNGGVVELALTQTDSTGAYVFNDIEPGTGYAVSFRTPSMGPILGTPFNQTNQTANGQASTGQNQLTAPNTGSIPFGGAITGITVYPSDNTVDQNLPLDPSGIVYDSVARTTIVGATVSIQGPAGFNPAIHLVGGAAGATYVTAADGLYQFLLLPGAPSGVYLLEVQNPASYLPPQASAGGVAPAQGILNVPSSTFAVQPQSTAPAVGVNGLPGTLYYLQLNFDFSVGSPEVVNNHIPLDPLNVGGRLQVEKTASANTVEVGDSLQYTIRVKNNSASPVTGVTVTDEPPAGFSLIDGTVILQVGAVRQGVLPTRLPGQRSFSLTIPGILAVGQEVTITYYMRAGVGAAQGSGTNTVRAGLPGQPNLASDKATVRIKGGVLGNDACLIGKVYVDNDGDRIQNNTVSNPEPGVPGVKLVMETGAYAITDAEGKYSICPIAPKTHVLRVDKKTLPARACMGLVPSSNQNAGDGSSIFADVKNGELHRADFILAGCTSAGMDAIKARRSAAPEAALQLHKEQSAAAASSLPAAPSTNAVLSSPANAAQAQ